MIRIFYPFYISHNSSIANLVKCLCENLDKSKFEPIAFADEEMEIEGVNIIKISTKNFYFKMFSLIPYSLKDIDVIHTGPQYTHIFSHLVSRLRNDHKLIFTVWGPCDQPVGKQSKILYRMADEVTAGSRCGLENAKKYIGERSGELMYYGIDVEKFRPIKVGEYKKPTVLYVGNLIDFQRPDLVLKLAKEMTSVNFIIKGDGPMLDGIRAKSKSLENVKILSEWISSGKLVELYNKADVFLQPSVKEGFGLVTAEAMACKTPVVGADATATPEVIGDTGFLFEPDNLQDAKNKVENLLENEDLRKRLGEKARERVENKFAVSRMVGDYSNLYEEITG